MLTSAEIKELARGLGADLVGIASVEGFEAAPPGARPRDVLESARAVVVLARRFPRGVAACESTIPYTVVRNQLTAIMDRLTFELALALEDAGSIGAPAGAIGPTNYDAATGRHRGLISLKHAGELAGLGRIGKNSLLVNERFGNMIWLGAVVTDAALEPDSPATYRTCPASCRACVEACPVGALDGPFVDQVACWNHAFAARGEDEWRIRCHRCRTMCPNSAGLGA